MRSMFAGIDLHAFKAFHLRNLGIAAAVLAVAVPAAEGEILTHAAFTEVATVGQLKVWAGADAEQPERVEFSDWATTDYQTPFHPPGSTYVLNWRSSGFVETFGGGLPKIEFAMTASQTGDQVAWGGTGAISDSSTVSGEVGYSVRAVPNDPRTPLGSLVPVVIRASGAVSASGSGAQLASAYADFEVEWQTLSGAPTGFTESDFAEARSFYTDPSNSVPADSFQFGPKKIGILSDQMLVVRLSAGGWARGWVETNQGLNSTESIEGWIDPIVYIDPTWEFSDEYHLEYSAGVVQYVPEPTALSLLIMMGAVLLVSLPVRARLVR